MRYNNQMMKGKNVQMKTLDLAVEYDANKQKYRIFDREKPDETLDIADSKEHAYQQMLDLAVKASAKTE